MLKKALAFLFKWFAITGTVGIFAAALVTYLLYRHIEPQLPDTRILKDVRYQVPLRILTQDGKLIAEFGNKKRAPVTFDQTPKLLVQAILAAEDDRFFEHPGVDYYGLLRAAAKLLLTGEKREGGSTITMQVARNFFLSPEKTFARKFKEIFLALKIERELSKQEILALYLNKIYLGHHAYGVAAAAQIYYGKRLDELTLAQLAMIAGIPKAPSNNNPISDPQRAGERRYYVLKRLRKLAYITEKEFNEAVHEPLTAKLHYTKPEIHAPYMAEMVREKIIGYLGPEAYTAGYRVYTTLDTKLQRSAQRALLRALHEYDERHGFRGTEGHAAEEDWQKTLAGLRTIGDARPAIVSKVEKHSVDVLLRRNVKATIPWEGLRWARRYHDENTRGPALASAHELVQRGDIVRVRKRPDSDGWMLTQVPEVEGALVAISPTDGAINALVGGFDFQRSNFNRATQAKRQPGSGFKPILYTTALERGFTPATLINDAPIVLDNGPSNEEWRPENYSGRFFGPTRLRVALRKSRNLVSIRLLRRLGVGRVVRSAVRFGLPASQLPRNLTLALGTGTASPLEMARVFAVFANGGFLIDPYFIDRIENPDGEVLYRSSPSTACAECQPGEEPPAGTAPRIISPQVRFLMYSLLQDVVQRGTAMRARELGRSDIAGKTGTTNEQRDAWFNGFSPYLAATAWVGFDSSKPLGERETGGRAALPMWMYFMKEALENKPDVPLEQPEGIVTMRIDPTTGLLASPGADGIFEYFIADRAPTRLARPDPATPFESDGGGRAPAPHIQSLF